MKKKILLFFTLVLDVKTIVVQVLDVGFDLFVPVDHKAKKKTPPYLHNYSVSIYLFTITKIKSKTNQWK
jgi:hypothetical protein